ncbi:hypothetical protein [Pedobacter steynii]|uniref:hypothetical protein n=1 Tax=Pedobacter steynii TaxID=430522 RepID=UPI0012FC9C87|nr:hypothetical protein [Pedobacter steynii]
MFFQLLIAMILGLTSPSNTTSETQNGVTTMNTEGDPNTGGDTGQNPPPKK